MKVLQIINSHADTAGGAEKLATQLHHGLRERGMESHLLCTKRAPSNRRENVYSLGLSSAYHPLAFLRLIRFLRRAKWREMDVIHVHLFPAQLLFVLVARILGLKAHFTTTEHNTWNRRRTLPGAKRLDRFYYYFYERIICISEGTEQTFREWLPETAPKLRTIWNGIDLSKVSLVPDKTGTSSEPIILSAARLTRQKNHGASVEAMKFLNGRPARLWIAGRGEMEGELRAQIKELGLEDRVKLLGFRNDLPLLFGKADIFLASSLWEGFGLSIAEAMAAGLPVVASDVAGSAEVVGKDGTCGLLADPRSPGDIAAKLGELLDNEERRRQMGSQARQRAALFDVERMIDEYLQLWREVSQ